MVTTNSANFCDRTPKVGNYLPNKLATDVAIAEIDVFILCDMKPAITAPQLYADDLVAKSGKVANVCDKESRIDVFIEEVDLSSYHSLRDYWPKNPN